MKAFGELFNLYKPSSLKIDAVHYHSSYVSFLMLIYEQLYLLHDHLEKLCIKRSVLPNINTTLKKI